MSNNNYGSVITEQGDLGLGVIPINESKKETKDDNKNKKDEKGSKNK